MVTSHPNAEIVRCLHDAQQRGDAGTLMDLLADDVVWHAGPSHDPKESHVNARYLFATPNRCSGCGTKLYGMMTRCTQCQTPLYPIAD